MNFPTIDGHFWVVRDGKIVDPVFPEYKMSCRMRNADWKNRSHLPASEITQKLMIGMYKKVLTNQFGNISFEEQSAEIKKFMKLVHGHNDPVMNFCFQNCLVEIHERGGELVFGSLGFKLKNGEGYWYEYGGVNYTSVKSFLK